MNEKKYQELFVSSVLNELENFPQEINENIIPIGKINSSKVLSVYSNDYKYRMLEVLQGNFETLWMVLGDERFEAVAFDFIKKFPSQSYDLNDYGSALAHYLSLQSELLDEIPFLVDLANFEMAFWKIFHAPNPPNLRIEDFSQERILNSYFEFDFSVKLLKFEHNVFPLFEYKDKTLTDFLENNSPEIVLRGAYYLIFKKDFIIIKKNLTEAQFNFFLQLNENKTILDIINSTSEATNNLKEDEIKEIFKMISSDLLRNLKDFK